MYPTPIAVGNMTNVYTKKNTPEATLAYVARQEELMAEKNHKVVKVGAKILIRGNVPTPLTSLAQDDTIEHTREEATEPLSDDGHPHSDLRAHDEIDDFFNPMSDTREEDSLYSQYDYSSPPSGHT